MDEADQLIKFKVWTWGVVLVPFLLVYSLHFNSYFLLLLRRIRKYKLKRVPQLDYNIELIKFAKETFIFHIYVSRKISMFTEQVINVLL